MANSTLSNAVLQAANRRSMLTRAHQEFGAEFRSVGDGIVVAHYGANTEREINEREQAKRLGIVDLSALARTGFKSKHTPQWLKSQHVVIPDQPNQLRVQEDGALVASLSWDEHLILSDLAMRSTLVDDLNAAYQHQPDVMCYPLMRAHSHGCFALTGECIPAMLAKVCGIDCQPDAFANGRVAQTSIARTNGILIRHDTGALLTYYVLADSASSEYMWGCFLDAMAEWQGQPIGLDSLI